MATLNGTVASLADWANRQEDERVAKIVELLSATNEVLDDMQWMEANMELGHKSVQRTGLPDAYWRLLNQGIPRSKSRTKQVTDAIGSLEAYSVVDTALADLNGNTAEFRASEDVAFLEAMNQEMATTLFYGASSEPEKFLGFSPRYDGTPQDTDQYSSTYNIIDAGGTGSDNTSIWLVGWGANTCFGTFPKGANAGFNASDKGEDTVTDGDGNEYQAYRTHFKWMSGLVVKDWRYVVRIANIDVSDLTNDAATGANLMDFMVEASERIPSPGLVKQSYYCNRKIRTFLRQQIRNKANVNLTFENVAGKKVLEFDGIPVRRTDALLNTEAQVA